MDPLVMSITDTALTPEATDTKSLEPPNDTEPKLTARILTNGCTNLVLNEVLSHPMGYGEVSSPAREDPEPLDPKIDPTTCGHNPSLSKNTLIGTRDG